MLIEVKERHIAHGRVNDCYRCPIAQALVEHLKPGYYVSFSGYGMLSIREGELRCVDGEYVGDYDDLAVFTVNLPAEAIGWQSANSDWLDKQSSSPPPPISFNLDIPKEYTTR